MIQGHIYERPSTIEKSLKNIGWYIILILSDLIANLQQNKAQQNCAF